MGSPPPPSAASTPVVGHPLLAGSRFKPLSVVAVGGLLIIAVVFLSELHRLGLRTSRTVRGTLHPTQPPIMQDAGDFTVFYAAGRLVRAGRAADLYNPDVIAPEILRVQEFPRPDAQRATRVARGEEAFLRFYNPPSWALLMVPLTYLSPLDAFQIITLINLLALIGVFVLIGDVLSWRLLPVCLLVLGVLSYDPTHSNIRGGQQGILLALVFGIVFLGLLRGSGRRSSWSLGILVVKPQFLLFPGLAAFSQSRKTILAALPLAMLLCLPFLLIGPDGVWDYIQLLISRGSLDSSDRGFARLNMSWPGFLAALFVSSPNQVAVHALQLLTLIPFVMVLRQKDLLLLPAAAAATSLLVVPHSHPQDWFLMVPGAAFLIARPARAPLLSVSFLLLFLIYVGTNSWERGLIADTLDKPAVYIATPAAFALLCWLAALPWLEKRLDRRVVRESVSVPNGVSQPDLSLWQPESGGADRAEAPQPIVEIGEARLQTVVDTAHAPNAELAEP